MKTTLIVIFLIVLAILLFFRPRYLNKAKPSDWDHPPLVRLQHATIIGNALYSYQSDHNGHLPNHLSELIPTYISYTNEACFFSYGFDLGRHDSSVTTNIEAVISQYGAYIYLGEAGFEHGVIICERQRLWPDEKGVTGYSNDLKNLVVMVNTNFEVMPIPVREIKRLLSESGLTPQQND